MIKRLLLVFAGALVLVAILLSNIPVMIILKIIGILIFTVLGISLFYGGIGCYSNELFIILGTICYFIALLLIFDLLGFSIFRNYELPTSLCQAVVSDMNGTIISNKTVPC